MGPVVKREIPGAEWIAAGRRIEPLRQGTLDGLCGLYAVINAIALARWPYVPVTSLEAAQLFEGGLYELNRSTDLAETVAEGMEWPTLRSLAPVLCLQASVKPIQVDLVRLPYSAPARTRENAVKRCISAQRPVIVNIDDRSHYSVIIGRSQTRYYLHDSAGGYWVSKLSTKLTHALAITCGQREALSTT